jgi:hypothetical protein
MAMFAFAVSCCVTKGVECRRHKAAFNLQTAALAADTKLGDNQSHCLAGHMTVATKALQRSKMYLIPYLTVKFDQSVGMRPGAFFIFPQTLMWEPELVRVDHGRRLPAPPWINKSKLQRKYSNY